MNFLTSSILMRASHCRSKIAGTITMTVEELRDEIDAINAIYPNSTSERGSQIYDCIIPQHENLVIQLSFPTEYPDVKPWCVQVVSHNQTKYLDVQYIERNVNEIIDRLFTPGMVVLYELFEELQVFLEKYNIEAVYQSKEVTPEVEKPKTIPNISEVDTISKSMESLTTGSHDPTALWIQSEPIVDRGSTFIAYAREVHSVEEAEELLDDLVTDKKIARAAHNISSWRIKGKNGVQYQDCDDDGETAAGGRLLHLLTMMNAWNVIVVVSRWFGGTHIGPDRFKHINSVAREAVLKGLFTDESTVEATGKHKKKK